MLDQGQFHLSMSEEKVGPPAIVVELRVASLCRSPLSYSTVVLLEYSVIIIIIIAMSAIIIKFKLIINLLYLAVIVNFSNY